MFKKKFKISSNNILSGKDKKKIIKDLSKICVGECVEHFFEKNDKIYQNKLQGSKIIIYSSEDYPAFIDATSKGDYFPTLYTIHQYPNLVQAIEIHPEVENFIHKGANLMWPGVKDPDSLGEFEKDEVVYIIDSKKNMIAVGAMSCSFEEYQKQADNKGIAVYILHQINDTLWETGPKKVLDPIQKLNQEGSGAVQQQQQQQEQAKPQKQPEQPQQQQEEIKQDNKKKAQEKKPAAETIKKKEESDDENDEIEEEDMQQFLKLQKKGKQLDSDDDEGGSAPQQQAQTKGKKEVKKAETKFSDDEDEKGGKKGKKKAKKAAKKETKEKPQKEKQKQQQHKEAEDNSEGEEGEEHNEDDDAEDKGEEAQEQNVHAEQKSDVPQEIMDQYLYDAFMNALKMSLQDKELPMDSSMFYQNHILQCKKENFNIDLRVSSYKKIGKFFQVMSKPPHNLIEYKEAKKGTAPQITKVNRKNQKLVEWTPTIFKVQSQKKDNEEKKVDQDAMQRVEVSELYKVKKGLEPIFGDLKKEEYLTKNEVKDKLNNYITKECKIDKKFVILDPFLASKFGTVEQEQPQQQDQQQAQPQQQQQQNPAPQPVKEEQEKPQVSKEEDFEDVEGDAGGDEEEEKQQQKLKIKRGQDVRQKLTREELQKRIDSQLIAYHQIKNLDTQEVKIKQGEFPGIQLITEKAHNKNITRIIGLENFGLNPNNFTNKFQIKFASSVNVHDLPGKDAGKELVIQGNFLQDLLDFFTEESKIDKKFIHQQDKLHKKKK